MIMDNFYDTLETRDHAERESAQMAALSFQVEHAQKNAPRLQSPVCRY